MQWVFAKDKQAMRTWRHTMKQTLIGLAGEGCRMLSGGMRSVRTIMMLWWGHWRLVHDASLLRRVCIEHDASLRSLSSQGAGRSLTSVRKSLGVVGTTHKEERVHSILLGLLTRHAKNASSRCCWGTWTNTEIAGMFPLTCTAQRGRWV